MNLSLQLLAQFLRCVALTCKKYGLKAVAAQNLLLKQQLIALNRGQQRGPSAFLQFKEFLVSQKYRFLFSSGEHSKPGMHCDSFTLKDSGSRLQSPLQRNPIAMDYFRSTQAVIRTFAVTLFGPAILYTTSLQLGAEPVTFTIDAKGKQTQRLSSPSGRVHDIEMNFSGELHLQPRDSSCDEHRFLSESAGLAGSVRVWGSANANGGGRGAERLDFDGSVDFNWAPSAMTSKFTPGNGSHLYWIADGEVFIPGNQGAIYGFEYVSELKILRLWITLPLPFSYEEQFEHYDFPATHSVSGTADAFSCLRGTVVDHVGKPIPNAEVILGGVTRITDRLGTFEFHRIPTNPYRLKIIMNGQEQLDQTETIPPFQIINKRYIPGPLPVILVFGWHGSHDNWNLIAKYLELDKFPVFILDYDSSLAPAPASQKLQEQIESVFEASGRDKVNLIAHSYGGLVSRHFIEELGNDHLVKNLIMLGTPNHGSRAADYLLGTIAEKPQATLLAYFLDWYGSVFRADLSWGSTQTLRTIGNEYLERLNLRFLGRSRNLETQYYVIAGTQPYPQKVTSHRTFFPGLDDGIVAVG